MKSRQSSTWGVWPARIIILAVLYACSGRLGQFTAIPPGQVTAIWPSSGIALAAVLLFGYRIWPGIWLGSFVVNMWAFLANKSPLPMVELVAVASWIGVGATSGALAGAVLLHRFVGCQDPFQQAQDVVKFVLLGAVVSCMVSPTLGVTGLTLSGVQSWADFGRAWWTWWLGDASGVMVMTPLLLVWSRPTLIAKYSNRPVEAVILLVMLTFTSWVAFFNSQYPLGYIPIPFLVWAAFRFGRHGATVTILLVTGIADTGTTFGLGPFATGKLSLNESLLMLQLFVGVVVMTTLVLTAVISEREQADLEVRRYRDHLEEQVQERTLRLTQTNVQLQEEIGERQRAELGTKAAKEAAEAANQAKSMFLANMSHELRTPLNAILGFAQLMGRDQVRSADDRENLSIITRSSEHLLALINDVLSISKIEAGQLSLADKSFDLLQLLHTLEEMFRLRAASKGLQFTFQLDPHLPQFVLGDEGKLRQVFINLLGNALKFTDQGGVVVRGEWHEGRAVFEIEDTGQGITQGEQEKLFGAFVQTQSGLRTKEGTGLGLAISRTFVRLMGGDIVVTSQLGKGTTFRLDIRLASAKGLEAHRIERKVIGLNPGQPTYRLLVVGERAEDRRMLVKLLTPIGFEMREAADGKEGVEAWESWNPHLIWMDLRMPVMDGYAVTRNIRDHASILQVHNPKVKTSPVRIIALSASVFEHEREAILAAGCDDFVAKPYRIETIFEKLIEHLGVQFLYQESKPTGAPSSAERVLSPTRLAALPADWIAGLNEAVDQGDIEAACLVAEQIRSRDAHLADELKHLIKNYRFDEIQAVLAGSLDVPPEASGASTEE